MQRPKTAFLIYPTWKMKQINGPKGDYRFDIIWLNQNLFKWIVFFQKWTSIVSFKQLVGLDFGNTWEPRAQQSAAETTRIGAARYRQLA